MTCTHRQMLLADSRKETSWRTANKRPILFFLWHLISQLTFNSRLRRFNLTSSSSSTALSSWAACEEVISSHRRRVRSWKISVLRERGKELKWHFKEWSYELVYGSVWRFLWNQKEREWERRRETGHTFIAKQLLKEPRASLDVQTMLLTAIKNKKPIRAYIKE